MWPSQILRTDFGLEVRWNGKHEVDVSVSTAYYNNTCGLCGSWNGDDSDDYHVVSSYHFFNVVKPGRGLKNTFGNFPQYFLKNGLAFPWYFDKVTTKAFLVYTDIT